MVRITTKKIKGNEYLYLVHSIRKNKKVIEKTIKYIGKKRPITREEFECMKLSFNEKDWILKDYIDELSYQMHDQMLKSSKKHKEYIINLDEIAKNKEKQRFLSIFISNSNAIEGSTMTVLDTLNYLFNDISPEGHPKKDLNMAQNLLNAWNYVEENNKRFPNEDDLKQLHKLVNYNIEENKTLGEYKKVQNYVGDLYTTSYLFTEEKLKKLLSWIKTAYKKINDFEVAFQSHAQFELIHPFLDGNGRVGRLLINWLLMYKDLMPLAIRSKKRPSYYSALLNSQRGKILAICDFCAKEYLEQYKFVI